LGALWLKKGVFARKKFRPPWLKKSFGKKIGKSCPQTFKAFPLGAGFLGPVG